MKKALLIFVVVAGIIVAVVVFRNKTAIAPGLTESPTVSESISPSPTISVTDGVSPTVTLTASPSPTATPLSQTETITFTNGTATPNQVTIKTGDTVKFINDDSIPHWPASGVHPTHQVCPGFDALRGLATGESYSFQFNEAKTCPWHDHLNPSIKGQIMVGQ